MLRNYFRRAGLTGCLLLVMLTAFAQYTVTGGKGTPLLAEDNSQNDIQVYLVYGMENVALSYTSSSGSHTWYRYTRSKLDAVKIPSTQNGTTSTVTNIEEGYGYFVEVPGGGLPKYIWIIDYSRYAFQVDELKVLSSGDPCSGVQFEGKGQLTTLYYYLPNNGFRSTLQREFEIIYDSLSDWSDESQSFPSERKTITKKIVATDVEGTTFRFSISEPPYADTEFTLKGDLFARHFNEEKTILTDAYTAVAVQLHVDTVLTMTDAPNMNSSQEGYNAPATIAFSAKGNEPVASRFLWRIYKIRDMVDNSGGDESGDSGDSSGSDSDGEAEPASSTRSDDSASDGSESDGTDEEEGTLLANYSGNDFEHTFREQGVYKAVAEVSDRSGACVATEELEITIAVSYLDIPNVFTPGTSPGMNDEFRVAYKSLVSFKAWVYNRWGKELYHWTDPAGGWDGKVGGKYVAPGAYYYVIEAVGSDGKKYKKAGDINILRSKRIQTEVIEDTTE